MLILLNKFKKAFKSIYICPYLSSTHLFSETNFSIFVYFSHQTVHHHQQIVFVVKQHPKTTVMGVAALFPNRAPPQPSRCTVDSMWMKPMTSQKLVWMEVILSTVRRWVSLKRKEETGSPASNFKTFNNGMQILDDGRCTMNSCGIFVCGGYRKKFEWFIVFE